MKSKDKKKKKIFEEDYKKILKESQKQNTPYFQNLQLINSGDFIIKFSLFQEMPNSITSTDTSVDL